MLRKDLVMKNPLSLLGHESDDILPVGGFGAVLASAGVGKTAIMVQIALNALLRDKNVLHISLNEPVHKVSLWYEEVFRNIAKPFESMQVAQLWETILTHRFIMTFQVEGFSVPRLKERLTDLTAQGIFFPQMMIIDGLPFDKGSGNLLAELKSLAADYRLPAWFSVRTSRSKELGKEGFPASFESELSDIFDVAIRLEPSGKDILVKAVKGENPDARRPDLFLDPGTLLVRNGS